MSVKRKIRKPTPGSWRAVADAQGTCGIMHPKKVGVAIAWLSSAHNPANGYVGEARPVTGYPEREANAALLIAAPKLFKALQMCLSALENQKATDDGYTVHTKAIRAGRKALAKATQPPHPTQKV